ncbi:MAG: hypothetical protein ABWZ88_22735, partial [Variovorax sp.]
GVVVEVGPHDLFMEKQGAYWRLYQAQLRQADDEDVVAAADERSAVSAVLQTHAAHPAGDA